VLNNFCFAILNLLNVFASCIEWSFPLPLPEILRVPSSVSRDNFRSPKLSKKILHPLYRQRLMLQPSCPSFPRLSSRTSSKSQTRALMTPYATHPNTAHPKNITGIASLPAPLVPQSTSPPFGLVYVGTRPEGHAVRSGT